MLKNMDRHDSGELPAWVDVLEHPFLTGYSSYIPHELSILGVPLTAVEIVVVLLASTCLGYPTSVGRTAFCVLKMAEKTACRASNLQHRRAHGNMLAEILGAFDGEPLLEDEPFLNC